MAILMAAMTSICFTSCGSDNDDEDTGNGTTNNSTPTPTPEHAPAGVVPVDLGLPSGTRWANMNVGANREEEYGLYFAWGETVGYTSDVNDGHYFYKESYKWWSDGVGWTKYCTKADEGIVDNKTVLDPEDDAATVNWGGKWHMPSPDEIRELLDNTTSAWTTVNGVDGRKFTSKANGNSIFLPAAGYRGDSELEAAGLMAFYLSSTITEGNPTDSYWLEIDSDGAKLGDDDRGIGCSVRPVRQN